MRLSLEQLALELFDHGIFRRETLPLFQLPGPLTLAFNLHSQSDPRQPGPISQELLHQCASHLYQLINNWLPPDRLDYQYVAGVPTTGDALAQVFCRVAGEGEDQPALRQLPMIKNEEDQIDFAGSIMPVAKRTGESPKLLLVDDRLATGATINKTIAAAEKQGLEVIGIAVILDLEAGGLQLLRNNGYNVVALFTLRELVSIYRRLKKISVEESGMILGQKN